MQRAYLVTFRLAVGFWGVSKRLFGENWVGSYENAFYGELPLDASLWVYLLGVIQVAIATALITNPGNDCTRYGASGSKRRGERRRTQLCNVSSG